jgi:hypothetical protein
MQFFEDNYGVRRPLTMIAKIGSSLSDAPSGGFQNKVYTVTLVDGEKCYLHEYESARLNDLPMAFVPAAAGTYLLSPPGEPGDEQPESWRTPVIAWAFTGDKTATPYTADGANDGLTDPCPILMPNGMVIEQCSQSWKSEEDWITEYRAQKVAANAVSADVD